jgi:hypothetical protein
VLLGLLTVCYRSAAVTLECLEMVDGCSRSCWLVYGPVMAFFLLSWYIVLGQWSVHWYLTVIVVLLSSCHWSFVRCRFFPVYCLVIGRAEAWYGRCLRQCCLVRPDSVVLGLCSGILGVALKRAILVVRGVCAVTIFGLNAV